MSTRSQARHIDLNGGWSNHPEHMTDHWWGYYHSWRGVSGETPMASIVLVDGELRVEIANIARLSGAELAQAISDHD
jgi:hypothetical protein